MSLNDCEIFGGREGIRTPGLLVANEALSQLSYSPTSSMEILPEANRVANQVGAISIGNVQIKERLAALLKQKISLDRKIATAGLERFPYAALQPSAHSHTAHALAESNPPLSEPGGLLRVPP
jgi:hypothetical protein